MAENMIIVLMTAFNFILMILLLVITLRENNKRREQLGQDRDNFLATLATLSEKLKIIDADPNSSAIPQPIPGDVISQSAGRLESIFLDNIPVPPPAGRNQVKVAIQKLKLGRDPESVGKELGLSRSEMGILMASARKTGDV